MKTVIVIRGPLGVGKTAVAKRLASSIKAKYISIDKILEENRMDEVKGKSIPVRNFIKANKIATGLASKSVKSVIDGNFYSRKQLENLVKNIAASCYVFTLKASLKTCIMRDKKRKRTYGKAAAEAVYNMSFDYGVCINTEKKSTDDVVKEIKSYLT